MKDQYNNIFQIYEILNKEGGKMKYEIFYQKLLKRISAILRVDSRKYIKENETYIGECIKKVYYYFFKITRIFKVSNESFIELIKLK